MNIAGNRHRNKEDDRKLKTKANIGNFFSIALATKYVAPNIVMVASTTQTDLRNWSDAGFML